MNIYKHELKMNLGSVITWSVGLTGLLLFYMSMFSSFSGDAELLNEMMSNFPPELLAAFGMDNYDLTTVLGFFGVAFLLAQICFAIQASNYGFGLVSIEERELTADFLLAKPIGRSQILTAKLLAALTCLTLTSAVVWIVSFITVNVFGQGQTYSTQALILVLASITIFQLFFLSVGVVVSLLVKRVRNVTPYSMALAFGMYVLSAFGGMLGEDSLDLVTPFKHFDPHYITAHAAYDMPLVMISVAVIVVSVIASYVLYQRRNIASAV